MRTCRKCGKTEDQFDSMGSFLAHCRSCKTETTEPDDISEVIKAALEDIAEDLDTEPDTIDDTEEPEVEQEEVQEIPSLPLSICPNVISYLPDNQLIKIVVIGRKQGDRFIVEETKYK